MFWSCQVDVDNLYVLVVIDRDRDREEIETGVIGKSVHILFGRRKRGLPHVLLDKRS